MNEKFEGGLCQKTATADAVALINATSVKRCLPGSPAVTPSTGEANGAKAGGRGGSK